MGFSAIIGAFAYEGLWGLRRHAHHNSTQVTPVSEQCRSCRFWISEHGLASEREHAQDYTQGRCRRHAPMTIVVSLSRYDAEKPLWPQVLGQDWCGDWQQFDSKAEPT